MAVWIYPGGLTDTDFADGVTASGWAPQTYLYGAHIVISESGTVVGFGVRAGCAGTVGLKFGLYTSGGSLVVQTTGSVSSGTVSWVDSGAISQAVSAATYYLLVSAGDSTVAYGYDTSGNGTYATEAYATAMQSSETLSIEADTGQLYGVRLSFEAGGGATNTDYSPGVGSSAYAGLAALVNPQFASPSADATDGNWTPSTGADLYACIDETLRSDTDYIQSGANPSSDSCTVKLGTITDPGTDVGFHLQYAAGAVGSTGQVVVSLRQGNSPGTEIAAWTHTGLPVGSYQEFDDPVTSAEAANITDYADLYLRIVAS